MPTPATVLFSAPPGRTGDDDLRRLARAAGFAVADHALGSAPAVDFDPVAVALVDVGERVEAAAAQTRRWRAELGDQALPVLWLAPPDLVAAGLDAGADVVLVRPVAPDVFVAQLKALARAQANADRVAARASEARLLGDQLKRTLAQLDREQEMARRVRAGFLPKSFPQVGAARFHVCYRARNRGGADFHDVRRLDEHHVGFFVGDVVGSGAASAGLLGAFVQQSVVMKEITGHSYRIVPPNDALAALNRQLVSLDADELPLVAVLAGVLNARTGALSLARAGGPAPVYVPADGDATAWALPGPFLGTPDTTYELLPGALKPGDRLLVGTDGVRPDGEPNPGPVPGLLDAATRHRALSGPAFVDAVARDLLQQVRHAADFTLLGLEVLV